MELKNLCKGCLVVTIALLFAACNNDKAANTETTQQEVNMQQPSDTAVLQKKDKMDSTAAKMENEKEENGKKEKDEKDEKDDD